MRTDLEAFLEKAADNSGLISRAQMKLTWQILQEAALDHLARERKSLDLGFCVIHPCPYRGSWKAQLYQATPSLVQGLKGQPQKLHEAIFGLAGVNDQMRNTSMLAFDTRHKTCYWGLEVEPKKGWYRASMEHENRKISALGASGYFKYVAKALTRLRPRLRSVYLGWLKTLSKPMAAPGRTSQGRPPYLAARVPRGRATPDTPSYLPEPHYDYGDTTLLAQQTEPDSIHRSHEGVLSLPDLQPRAIDLRDAGGAAGMRVLDVGEGQADEGQLLAMGEDAGGARVEGHA